MTVGRTGEFCEIPIGVNSSQPEPNATPLKPSGNVSATFGSAEGQSSVVLGMPDANHPTGNPMTRAALVSPGFRGRANENEAKTTVPNGPS